MAKWLDKYEQGGLVLKKKTKDNFDLKANPNDVKASVGPGYVGDGYDTTGRNYSPAWGGQFQDGGALPEVTVYGHRNPGTKAYFDKVRKDAEYWQDRDLESPINGPMAEYLAKEQIYGKYGAPKINVIGEDDRPHYNPFNDSINIPDFEKDYKDSFFNELAHKVQANNKGRLGFAKQFAEKDLVNTLKNMSIGDIFNGSAWKDAYEKNYFAKDTLENDAHEKIYPKLMDEFKTLKDKEYNKFYPNEKKAMGGGIPGAVGFTYARTAGSAPANGKYTKKTKASAQDGKKLYGATDEEEESVKNFAKNYYASDRFKENLYDKGNFGIKDRSAQVSKDAINKINNLSYTYKPLDRTGFDKGNIINMGNPNEYLNAPKDLAFAHEMFHPMETEILSSQPRNVMVMLNHNALKNRKGDANALYQDMVDPLPTYIGGVAHYLPVGDKIQHEIKDFATNEQSLSSTSMHDDLIGEVRADIMALRYLANKKGIWDVTKSGVKDMTPEMLNELYKSPELNKQMYKSSSSGKTTYLPSKKAKEPGSLKAVDPPKNPGLMLDRLKQRYSDADLLYLMNKLAYESNNQDQTIAQNGKEMAFYQNGLDFKPKSISQNGVKKSKKSEPEVSPYKPVDAGIANMLRRAIPLPLNVSQALAKTVAGDARLNETSLDDDQKLILWNTIQNARKRSGKQTGGGTQYSDYGDQGYGKGEDFDNWFNRGKIGALSGAYNSLTNPGFVMASTVGRGRYWTDPENPDDINYTDVYDWNTSEKNYKGGNAYQKIRNLVRSTEDKSLNKTKNDKTRMNIHLTKKEIDAIKKRKEMKLSSLIAFDKGGVIKDDMGQWTHPGEITQINSNDITMQGVDYPVLGVSDTGDTKLMQPGENYKFKGKKVTEFPIAQDGKKLKNVKGESEKFLKGWMDSPMYNKMINTSINASPNQQEEILKAISREDQLKKMSWEFADLNADKSWLDKLSSPILGQFVQDKNKVLLNPNSSDAALSEVGVHEGSHATDLGGANIPSSDVEKMWKYRKEYAKQKGFFTKLLDDEDFNTYVGRPTETRARLNAIRYLGKKEGIYDPYKEKVDKDILKKLPSSIFHPTELDQLRLIYSDDQIIDLLNSVSKNDSNKLIPQAQDGGWLNKYK